MDNNTTEISWFPLFPLGEHCLKGSWSIVLSPGFCQFYSYDLFVHDLFEATSKIFRRKGGFLESMTKQRKGLFFLVLITSIWQCK